MKTLDNQFEYWDSVSSSKTFTHPVDIDRFHSVVSSKDNILDFGCGYGRTCDEFKDKYGIYGVFELPEGTIVRHHDKDWILSLLRDFITVDLFDIEVTTMNGNTSLGFQYFGRKRGIYNRPFRRTGRIIPL